MTPEPFPLDRCGWKAATDTKPEQCKIDLPQGFSASRQVHPKGGGLELSLRPEAGSSQWCRAGARLHEGSTTSHHASETSSFG